MNNSVKIYILLSTVCIYKLWIWNICMTYAYKNRSNLTWLLTFWPHRLRLHVFFSLCNYWLATTWIETEIHGDVFLFEASEICNFLILFTTTKKGTNINHISFFRFYNLEKLVNTLYLHKNIFIPFKIFSILI